MKKRIGVVGAGIAGLTCAYELQKAGFEVVVYEKEPHVGGRMSSRVKEDFIFDLGADHLCDLYDHMKEYCREFGIEWEKMRFLNYGVFRDGEIRSMTDAIGRLSKVRMAIQYMRTKDVGDFFNLNHLAIHDNDNAYDFMRRRTGKEVADYFVDSFSTTYQFHRAKEISLAAMFGIMKSIERDKDRWHLHRTRGGMQALPNALASRLDIRLSNPVHEVIAGDRVSVRDGKSETFDAVVLASQANASLRMLKNPTAKQRDLLSKTQYAASISVAFRVDRDKLPDTAIVWVPYVESRKISGYVNEAMKGEELVHGGKSLICAWLHEDFAREIMMKRDDEIFALVKQELVRVCPWFESVDEIESFDMQKWPEAMPKFAHGHLSRVKSFLEDGQGERNVFLCGDYMNSPWTEGALRGGQRTAERVTSRLLG